MQLRLAALSVAAALAFIPAPCASAPTKPAAKSTRAISIGEDDVEKNEVSSMRRDKDELSRMADDMNSSVRRNPGSRDSPDYVDRYETFQEKLRSARGRVYWNQAYGPELRSDSVPRPSDAALLARAQEKEEQKRKEAADRAKAAAEAQQSGADAGDKDGKKGGAGDDKGLKTGQNRDGRNGPPGIGHSNASTTGTVASAGAGPGTSNASATGLAKTAGGNSTAAGASDAKAGGNGVGAGGSSSSSGLSGSSSSSSTGNSSSGGGNSTSAAASGGNAGGTSSGGGRGRGRNK